MRVSVSVCPDLQCAQRPGATRPTQKECGAKDDAPPLPLLASTALTRLEAVRALPLLVAEEVLEDVEDVERAEEAPGASSWSKESVSVTAHARRPPWQ